MLHFWEHKHNSGFLESGGNFIEHFDVFFVFFVLYHLNTKKGLFKSNKKNNLNHLTIHTKTLVSRKINVIYGCDLAPLFLKACYSSTVGFLKKIKMSK